MYSDARTYVLHNNNAARWSNLVLSHLFETKKKVSLFVSIVPETWRTAQTEYFILLALITVT